MKMWPVYLVHDPGILCVERRTGRAFVLRGHCPLFLPVVPLFWRRPQHNYQFLPVTYLSLFWAYHSWWVWPQQVAFLLGRARRPRRWEKTAKMSEFQWLQRKIAVSAFTQTSPQNESQDQGQKGKGQGHKSKGQEDIMGTINSKEEEAIASGGGSGSSSQSSPTENEESAEASESVGADGGDVESAGEEDEEEGQFEGLLFEEKEKAETPQQTIWSRSRSPSPPLLGAVGGIDLEPVSSDEYEQDNDGDESASLEDDEVEVPSPPSGLPYSGLPPPAYPFRGYYPGEYFYDVDIVDKTAPRPWIREQTKDLDPDGAILSDTIKSGDEIRRKYNELVAAELKRGRSSSRKKFLGCSTKDIRQLLRVEMTHHVTFSPIAVPTEKKHKKRLVLVKPVASTPLRHKRSRGRLLKAKSRENLRYCMTPDLINIPLSNKDSSAASVRERKSRSKKNRHHHHHHHAHGHTHGTPHLRHGLENRSHSATSGNQQQPQPLFPNGLSGHSTPTTSRPPPGFPPRPPPGFTEDQGHGQRPGWRDMGMDPGEAESFMQYMTTPDMSRYDTSLFSGINTSYNYTPAGVRMPTGGMRFYHGLPPPPQIQNQYHIRYQPHPYQQQQYQPQQQQYQQQQQSQSSQSPQSSQAQSPPPTPAQSQRQSQAPSSPHPQKENQQQTQSQQQHNQQNHSQTMLYQFPMQYTTGQGQSHAQGHVHNHTHPLQQQQLPPPTWFFPQKMQKYAQPPQRPQPQSYPVQGQGQGGQGHYPQQPMLPAPTRTHYWQDVIDHNTRQLHRLCFSRGGCAGTHPLGPPMPLPQPQYTHYSNALQQGGHSRHYPCQHFRPQQPPQLMDFPSLRSLQQQQPQQLARAIWGDVGQAQRQTKGQGQSAVVEDDKSVGDDVDAVIVTSGSAGEPITDVIHRRPLKPTGSCESLLKETKWRILQIRHGGGVGGVPCCSQDLEFNSRSQNRVTPYPDLVPPLFYSCNVSPRSSPPSSAKRTPSLSHICYSPVSDALSAEEEEEDGLDF